MDSGGKDSLMELTYLRAGIARKVYIRNRKILIVSPEVKTFTFDLNELEKHKDKVPIGDFETLINLKTEDEIEEEITKDFNKSGWRLVKKDV